MDAKAARRWSYFPSMQSQLRGRHMRIPELGDFKEDPYDAGVIIGSGIGSLPALEREYSRLLTKGPTRISPMFVPMMISDMAAGNVSIQLGFKGKCTNVVTACIRGTLHR